MSILILIIQLVKKLYKKKVQKKRTKMGEGKPFGITPRDFLVKEKHAANLSV